jgi:DNA-binding response OmpR family regulator
MTVAKHETLTVLIIEDDTDILNFTSRVLEMEGYQVLRASDGRTGLEIVREKPVSLVLLDLRLPELDGWSVLREMKQDVELARIPVVVLTAIAEPTQRRKTLNMGAIRYLVKPLSVNNLSRAVADTLNEKGTQELKAVESGVISGKSNTGN